MESYKDIKMEDHHPMYFIDNNSFGVTNNHSLISDYNINTSSLGFMELLGFHQDFCSVFELPKEENHYPAACVSEEEIKPPSSSVAAAEKQKSSTTTVVATGNVLNTPSTPNCSSISSEGHGDADGEVENHEQKNTNAKQQLKAKKTVSQKKQKEPRFAFMTKSEVDFLEDGYRWRKYGQKAVKNSPFPRNYYRCTNATCNVKKRVERCFSDPSTVVTTYEGKHTHPSPMNTMISRPNCYPINPLLPSLGAYTLPMQFNTNQSFNDNLTTSSNLAFNNQLDHAAFVAQGRRFCSTNEILGDQENDLQNLMPSAVLKHDYNR
ncbi:WRKY transcription factor 23 [Solanum pennellii]|uniref:WRKY transcription factor 23 n=1 Tax=Solanum pennellii TaxID=28526 RepID=A0ABM1GBU0_SOLPN|nr:WRKY transcription factor 23 [Solanum pennellii]